MEAVKEAPVDDEKRNSDPFTIRDLETMNMEAYVDMPKGLGLDADIANKLLGGHAEPEKKPEPESQPKPDEESTKASIIADMKQFLNTKHDAIDDDYNLFKEKLMARIPKMSTPSGNIP